MALLPSFYLAFRPPSTAACTVTTPSWVSPQPFRRIPNASHPLTRWFPVALFYHTVHLPDSVYDEPFRRRGAAPYAPCRCSVLLCTRCRCPRCACAHELASKSTNSPLPRTVEVNAGDKYLGAHQPSVPREREILICATLAAHSSVCPRRPAQMTNGSHSEPLLALLRMLLVRSIYWPSGSDERPTCLQYVFPHR